VVFNTGPYTVLPNNSILITANMQSETGFQSSHQLKFYVASKSRLKLAVRAVLSADAGLLVYSRLFVLYCRSRPKDDKSRNFDPHFEEVRGGVERWWMARWNARAEFLLSVIERLFLSLTVEALQGKMCQNSLPSGVGRSLAAKISGGRGRPWGIFLGFDKTRHILLSNSANCTVLHAVVLTQYRRVTDRRTDRQTADRRNCCR